MYETDDRNAQDSSGYFLKFRHCIYFFGEIKTTFRNVNIENYKLTHHISCVRIIF